jgi:hypothetical protein
MFRPPEMTEERIDDLLNALMTGDPVDPRPGDEDPA